MNKQAYFQELMNQETSTKQKLFYSAVYLFSHKGFANVGIRELCASVKVKESAFYNHYKSKDEIFSRILEYLVQTSNQVKYSDKEIEKAVKTGDIRLFFEQNMQKFMDTAGNPLYHTILQIVMMESFIHPEARTIAYGNLYYLRRDYTEKVLRGMLDGGAIRECDPRLVTASYYYGLKGLLDEYLLLEVWDDDVAAISLRIKEHVGFFVDMLRK